uniref:Uncharacterized protein n=1 Tax=Chromera velia CCMP2878 TaxID=1169474 RepID=A0A0G4HJK2_9ALVE|eukprot:Cvel_7137.t1-p1 / transcript=Cvel_7137.t1 / gene=Cvel_7137 / organism=Chromera_velia_CCMP2878 / gene_product=Uncharacterized protein DR_0269, putative / transcript_product=Uncharacterized protein DR_0269, putative / location=Cvel_scaffold366:55150-58635(-) / protein_length=244 / sequence_SO=supercontig / SO=protein_coding / is_pseudo=false
MIAYRDGMWAEKPSPQLPKDDEDATGATAEGAVTSEGGATAEALPTAEGAVTSEGGAIAEASATAEGAVTSEGGATAEASATTEGAVTSEDGAIAEASATTEGAVTSEGGATAEASATTEGAVTSEGGAIAEASATIEGAVTSEGGATAEGAVTSEGDVTAASVISPAETPSSVGVRTRKRRPLEHFFLTARGTGVGSRGGGGSTGVKKFREAKRDGQAGKDKRGRLQRRKMVAGRDACWPKVG